MNIKPSSNHEAIDQFLNGNCTWTSDMLDVMRCHGMSETQITSTMAVAVDLGRMLQSHNVPVPAVAEILLQCCMAGMKSQIEQTAHEMRRMAGLYANDESMYRAKAMNELRYPLHVVDAALLT